MSTRRGWTVAVVALGVGLAALVSCGPKESGDDAPARRTTPPPEARPSGPPKKLMPAEMRTEVDQVFTTQTGDLERCYNDYVVATGQKTLKGTIIVAVTIGWRKHPSKVWFLKNEFASHARLTQCFLDKVRAWEFPTWGGEMDYSFRRLTLEEL